ncbi:hypothetical protein ACJZ2D_000580 [Fusarium nematophilum]
MSQSSFENVVSLARAIHSRKPAQVIWKALDETVAHAFGYRLFTILVYDSKTATICRLYSTRENVQPVGGRKRATESPWVQRVLKDGQLYLGSTGEDMKVFSEYEFLATLGCESVLNIPMRSDIGGKVVGSLNLLAGANNYDDADQGLAVLIAQLVAGLVEASREDLLSKPFYTGNMESV